LTGNIHLYIKDKIKDVKNIVLNLVGVEEASLHVRDKKSENGIKEDLKSYSIINE